jgi:hypothetical protein
MEDDLWPTATVVDSLNVRAAQYFNLMTTFHIEQLGAMLIFQTHKLGSSVRNGNAISGGVQKLDALSCDVTTTDDKNILISN